MAKKYLFYSVSHFICSLGSLELNELRQSLNLSKFDCSRLTDGSEPTKFTTDCSLR